MSIPVVVPGEEESEEDVEADAVVEEENEEEENEEDENVEEEEEAEVEEGSPSEPVEELVEVTENSEEDEEGEVSAVVVPLPVGPPPFVAVEPSPLVGGVPVVVNSFVLSIYIFLDICHVITWLDIS